MIRRKLVTRRNRRKVDPSQLPPATDANAAVTAVGGDAQIDFDVPVNVNGVLQMTADDALPLSMVVNSQTRITLHYAATFQTDVVWVIPARDPAVRTAVGGYVAALNGKVN